MLEGSGDLRQDDPLPARGDVGDVVDRDEHETAAEDAGADDEGVRLIGSSPEHDGLDEAEATLGGVDPEALAATEPVEARTERFPERSWFVRVHGSCLYSPGPKWRQSSR